MTMRILIVGAGKTGTAVASAATREHTVTLLELRAQHVDEASRLVEGARVVRGSGTEFEDLEAAGVRVCDAVVVTSGSDEVNLVVATIAKFGFGVPLVVSRVVDRRNAWLFDSDMGVDVAVDETGITAQTVMEALGTAPP
jgi:trk system potassium uptake protein